MYLDLQKYVNIHGPSLGIGAAIAVVSVLAGFYIMDNFTTQSKPMIIESLPEDEIPSKKFNLDVFTENASPYLGDPNAPITMVEFGDYQCFFCNRFFHDTEPALVKEYVDTGKVKILFKDFTIIGPDSVNAAHAAHCANEQGKFWEYHDTLYNNWDGENNGWAGSENLLKFAQEVNLNIDEFTDCMLDARYQNIIVASNDDAKALGLDGTPGFFIIGPDLQITPVGGAQPFEVFKRIFDSELQK